MSPRSLSSAGPVMLSTGSLSLVAFLDPTVMIAFTSTHGGDAEGRGCFGEVVSELSEFRRSLNNLK